MISQCKPVISWFECIKSPQRCLEYINNNVLFRKRFFFFLESINFVDFGHGKFGKKDGDLAIFHETH